MKDHNDFIRQRRNLMIISLVILFAENYGLEIRKISLLGTELIIKNPNSIYHALWAAFAYWLVRYYQCFRDLGDKGFKQTLWAQMDILLPVVAYKLEKSKDDKLVLKEPKKSKNMKELNFKLIEKNK